MTNRITKAFDEFGIENFKSWSKPNFLSIGYYAFWSNSSGRAQ